jgi:AI-2 transport protein TqsA
VVEEQNQAITPGSEVAPSPPSAEDEPVIIDPVRFQRRLTVVTLAVLLVVLTIYLLREFSLILQPLFIAVFVLYLIVPAHRSLVMRGVRSEAAYGLILVVILVVLYGLGRLVYGSAEQLFDKWPDYEKQIDNLLVDVQKRVPFLPRGSRAQGFRDLLQIDTLRDLVTPLRAVAGPFIGFFTGLVVVSIYLIFLVAEKITLPERLERALGKERAGQVLAVAATVNTAIARYLGIKALINLLAALATVVILAVFGVPFVATWALVTFLFKFIPYVGTVVVVGAPLLVCLLENLNRLWVVIVVGVLLAMVHQVLGNYVEPRMMGSRLGVSPLLILLSLTFWGLIWGVVGMILAIPLLMVIKIVLDNIPETRPIATLMSSE